MNDKINEAGVEAPMMPGWQQAKRIFQSQNLSKIRLSNGTTLSECDWWEIRAALTLAKDSRDKNDKINEAVERSLKVEAVYEKAETLVLLWQAQKISGASRADRNAAIEGAREELIEAVKQVPSFNG